MASFIWLMFVSRVESTERQVISSNKRIVNTLTLLAKIVQLCLSCLDALSFLCAVVLNSVSLPDTLILGQGFILLPSEKRSLIIIN